MRRPIQGTAVGNFMEWYDFGIYGYIATNLARVFFPGHNASPANLIATFGTLAAAFAVRPLGGVVFGFIGDRVGRKPVLVTTVLLMTLGTTTTGVLPGYDAIGIWAPVLLVLTRVLQGFSTGGEYVGTMIYVGEHAPDSKRGMMAGFLPLSSQGGFVAAAALVTALQSWLPDADMVSWGWRIPLLLSTPFGLIAIFLRLRLEESPAYEEANGSREASDDDGPQFKRMIIEQRKPLLICIALVATYNVAAYMLAGYLPTYTKTITDKS
jgi:MHS family proline/betaine transporter-like MFS transporter